MIIETFYQSGMIGVKKVATFCFLCLFLFPFLFWLVLAFHAFAFLLCFCKVFCKLLLRLWQWRSMAEQDHEQRRDLRLEATALFVRQQLSANLGPAASRRRGNLFRQQLANEKYTNDMTFRVLNNVSGQERADFIQFAESKLLEPPRETRIFAPVISSGATSSATASAGSSGKGPRRKTLTAETTQIIIIQKTAYTFAPTSPVEEFGPVDQGPPLHMEDDLIQDPSQDQIPTNNVDHDPVADCDS